MKMSNRAVLDGVRGLLSQHAYEYARNNKIHMAMLPWTRKYAAGRFTVLNEKATPGGRYDRHIQIAQDSQVPFLPLVLDTFAQSMKIENYFSGNYEQSPLWEHWQRNAMDAAQTGITRAALKYGTSYAVVDRGAFPGQASAPLITGVSPRMMTAYYGESRAWPGEYGLTSEWPILALEIRGARMRLIDENYIYYIGARHAPKNPAEWVSETWNNALNLQIIEARPHGAGVPPVVRFRDRWLLDGEEHGGIIEPLLSLQDRIDRTSYEMGIAQYYAAFKQRYIIGWAPKDELDGIRMKANDVWFINADGTKTKVGQFEETDLTRYIDSKQATIRDLAAIAQVPAQSLGANAISNISADGLAAMESAKDRKASEIQTSLGESYEQLLRLCGHMDGDADSAADFAGEVKWKDTTARSFAQTVDALGKLATMLGIPAEALLEDIPGFTEEKIQRILTKYGYPSIQGDETQTMPEVT